MIMKVVIVVPIHSENVGKRLVLGHKSCKNTWRIHKIWIKKRRFLAKTIIFRCFSTTFAYIACFCWAVSIAWFSRSDCSCCELFKNISSWTRFSSVGGCVWWLYWWLWCWFSCCCFSDSIGVLSSEVAEARCDGEVVVAVWFAFCVEVAVVVVVVLHCCVSSCRVLELEWSWQIQEEKKKKKRENS